MIGFAVVGRYVFGAVVTVTGLSDGTKVGSHVVGAYVLEVGSYVGQIGRGTNGDEEGRAVGTSRDDVGETVGSEEVVTGVGNKVGVVVVGSSLGEWDGDGDGAVVVMDLSEGSSVWLVGGCGGGLPQ